MRARVLTARAGQAQGHAKVIISVSLLLCSICGLESEAVVSEPPFFAGGACLVEPPDCPLLPRHGIIEEDREPRHRLPRELARALEVGRQTVLISETDGGRMRGACASHLEAHREQQVLGGGGVLIRRLVVARRGEA